MDQPNSHPDDHDGLNGWPLYGPKDSTIADLVEVLARDKGLRLVEIEAVIKDALLEKLNSLSE